MRYFINGMEVTKEQAEKQLELNDSILKMEDVEKCIVGAKHIEFVITLPEGEHEQKDKAE